MINPTPAIVPVPVAERQGERTKDGQIHTMIDLHGTEPMKKDENFFRGFQKSRKVRENTTVIADAVYARLLDAILTAEFRPNKRLVEDELSEWLNVSRTPIREALLCLEKDGLVERKNGWVVHEHTPSEIKARLDCRLMIESYAARQSAASRTDTDLLKLRCYAEAMEKLQASSIEYYRYNDRFHQTIVDAARNPTLSHLYSQTKLNYWNLGVPILYGVELNQKMLAQHSAVVDALEAGDGDLAESISRDHVQLHKEVIGKSLEAMG